MDLKGYDALNEVLGDAGAGAEVYPRPEEDESVRWVTVRNPGAAGIIHALVLNALDDANLGEQRAGPVDHSKEVELVPVPHSWTQNSITFEDKRYRPSQIPS